MIKCFQLFRNNFGQPSRPKFRIIPTRLDKILDLVGALVLIGLWVLTFVFYPRLPDEIPSHFNASGLVDGYSSRSSILLLPAVASLVFILLTLSGRFPYWFNFPVKITPANAVAQYTNACRMLRTVKLAIIAIFFLIEWQTLCVALGKTSSIGGWMLPFTLVLAFAPTLYYIVQSYRLR